MKSAGMSVLSLSRVTAEPTLELLGAKKKLYNDEHVARVLYNSIVQRCTSPESMDEVSPYSPLQFPLSDEQYAHLLKDMPPGHPTMENRNYSYEDHPPPPPTLTPTLSTQ
ncbi:uncharacterized protein LOC103522776, partial [Diaphorina citri]|uniref:Uncharacterized protein LOC103522776 n=1 Tax=Diaphorina citri TaxID=121845 RepID=A0A1S3DRV9_DIACI